VTDFNCFWVHPETGVVHETKIKKKKYKRVLKDVKILGDYHQLAKINGVWYEIKAKRTAFSSEYKFAPKIGPRDPILGKSDLLLKIVYKKQLSKKEKRDFGLE
jgi:hypothetical protein